MDDGENLRSALERSRGALQRGRSVRDLRVAAVELGAALYATGEDDDLWDRLSKGTGAFRAAQLSQDQLTQLQVIVDLDWARLLNESGYQPPPPAEGQAFGLKKALAEALNRGGRANLGAAREQLRAIGKALVEVGEQRNISRRELRRELRDGVRVAGKVLVVIGVVVASGVAAGPLAAAVGVPLLAAHVGVGLVFEGAGIVLEHELDHVGSHRANRRGRLDPADADAIALLFSVRTEELRDLVEQWRELGHSSASEELVSRTRQYYDQATAAFYDAWNSAVTAPWYDDLEPMFYDVNNERQRLCVLLTHRPEANPVATVDALQRFADLGARLQAAIDVLANKEADDEATETR